MQSKIKARFIHISQIIFLTFRFFFQNNLGACAYSCTFGFIFSFIPILMMILTIFIEILHASPTMLEGLSNLVHEFFPIFDINAYISGISKGIVLNWMNLLLAIFIIWMARRLFLSIIKSLSIIFNTVAPSRPVINQIITFAGELIAVIVCAIVFFAAFTTKQIFSLPIFDEVSYKLPFLFGQLSNTITNLALYILLFLFTCSAYKVGSGTKPKLRLCVFCAAFCSISFYVSFSVISMFLNKANYNTIYGVLSNLVILLFEVYIFFVLFMFFAQLIYTVQFFYPHLLGELYLLPRHDNVNLIDSLRRILFITPSVLMNKENTVHIKAETSVYKNGDAVDCVFYLAEGTVIEQRGETTSYIEKGTFFGDFEFILNTTRLTDVKTQTDCVLVKISKEDFSELLDKNPKAALKALSKLSYYTARLYGRNNEIFYL